MPNSLLLLDTSMSSTESSDENCDLTALSTPIYWEIYARTLIRQRDMTWWVFQYEGNAKFKDTTKWELKKKKKKAKMF